MPKKKRDEIFVYAIYFPTSKKYYIGRTCDLYKRMQAHFIAGSLVCRALWKYDDWQITILHTTNNKELANQLEIEDIRNFKSVNPDGYNLTRGGDGGSVKGRKHSKEAKKKMSISKIGNKNSKGCKNFLGKTHTKEAKEKMSKAKRENQNAQGGRSINSKIRMAISQYKYHIKRLEEELKNEKETG